MSQIGNVGVKKNSGAIVGIQPSIDFIEGANITLTIADDPTNHDVNVTIAGAAAPAGAQDIFHPAPNPDAYKGTYATMMLADDQDTIVVQTFHLPANWDTDWSVDIVVIPDADGNLRWGVSTNFGAACTEDFDTHTDSIALGQTAVLTDDLHCLDITGALGGATAGDLVGVQFTRDGSDALDTIDDEVHYVGILMQPPVNGEDVLDEDIFYPAPNPDDYKGTYASMLMVDAQDTTIRQTFYLPTNWDDTWGVEVIVIPDANGDLRRSVATNFGTACTDDFDDQTDAIVAGQVTLVVDVLECIDITAALTGAAGGDLVGLQFTREASNVLDTIGDEVHYVGVLVTVPPEA